MDYALLRKTIISLANLPSCDAPLISAYFDLTRSRDHILNDFKLWVSKRRKTFRKPKTRYFSDAANEIEAWLLSVDATGAAVFVRHGEHHLFLPMTFQVHLEEMFHVNDHPAIYPLVELKDKFNRFVLVLLTEEYARILEMNLGSASVELIAKRSDLMQRAGREWTREHYHNYRRERHEMFIQEKIAIIEQLMSKRGHNSLIIAGDPRYVDHLKKSLPKHLSHKVIDEIKTGIADDGMQEIVSAAINVYLSAENQHVHSDVEKLIESVNRSGLATLGYKDTLQALVESRASDLVVSNVLSHKRREDLVRRASQQGLMIKTIDDSDLLNDNGGVGAFLKYKLQPSLAY